MKVSAVVAFAFGTPKTILSNQIIGELASKQAYDEEIPVYTQYDVPIIKGVRTTYADEKIGTPPPTLRIARGAVAWAKYRLINHFYVVAAKPHLWRAVRDLERATQEYRVPIEIQVCPEIELYPETSWFCADSTQERVRTPKDWNKRERILKLMPFSIYKLVAS